MTLAIDKRGVFALILLAFLYAAIGPLLRLLENEFNIFQRVYLQAALSFVFLSVFFKNKINFNKLQKIKHKEWLLLALRSMLFFLGGGVLYTLAIYSAKLANVAVLQILPFIAIFGVFINKETITLKKIFLIFLSFMGALLLSVGELDIKNFRIGTGELLSIVSGAAFSLAAVLRKKHSNLLNDIEMTFLMFGLGTIFVFLASLVSGISMEINLTAYNFLLLSILAIVVIIITILTNYGFSKVKDVLANVLLNLEPVFAIILGAVLYKEFLIPAEIVGSILIVASAVIFNFVK